MTSAVHPRADHDQTALGMILRRAAMLGALQAAVVLLFSVASRFLDGAPEQIVRSVLVLAGVTATTLLPGLWTRARTIEGIAGAAGIGLAATAVFLVIDVVALQPLGTYTNRWLEIGGGSNWWYHPVWWMVGTFLAWMGAFAMARQTVRRGEPAPVTVMVLGVGLAVVLGVVATLAGFPGAALALPTFAVAYLPALALTVLLAGRGAPAR